MVKNKYNVKNFFPQVAPHHACQCHQVASSLPFPVATATVETTTAHPLGLEEMTALDPINIRRMNCQDRNLPLSWERESHPFHQVTDRD